jgi:hypothetical protein
MKLSLLLGVLTVAVVASCGGVEGGPGPTPDRDAGQSDTGSAARPSADAGTPDATTEADAARAGGATRATVVLAAEECYTFDSDTVDGKVGCRGDVEAVFDVRGTALGFASKEDSLCHFLGVSGGQFSGISVVPRDYSGCNWVDRVAGPFFVGGQNESLTRHGLIVRTAGPHHYRIWIESDALPRMRFQWDRID